MGGRNPSISPFLNLPQFPPHLTVHFIHSLRHCYVNAKRCIAEEQIKDEDPGALKEIALSSVQVSVYIYFFKIIKIMLTSIGLILDYNFWRSHTAFSSLVFLSLRLLNLSSLFRFYVLEMAKTGLRKR